MFRRVESADARGSLEHERWHGKEDRPTKFCELEQQEYGPQVNPARPPRLGDAANWLGTVRSTRAAIVSGA